MNQHNLFHYLCKIALLLSTLSAINTKIGRLKYVYISVSILLKVSTMCKLIKQSVDELNLFVVLTNIKETIYNKENYLVAKLFEIEFIRQIYSQILRKGEKENMKMMKR